MNNADKLRFVFWFLVDDPDTNDIVNNALTYTGNSLKTEWPGTTFAMGSDEGKAILGTPTGTAVAELLSTHKGNMGPLKTISFVTAFSVYGLVPVLLFWIVPLDEPSSEPFTGEGNLIALDDDGDEQGCLASDGTWVVDTACGIFTATQLGRAILLLLPLPPSLTPLTGSGNSIKTNQGPCQINQMGYLTCAIGLVPTAFTNDDRGYLSYRNTIFFYAVDSPSIDDSQAVSVVPKETEAIWKLNFLWASQSESEKAGV